MDRTPIKVRGRRKRKSLFENEDSVSPKTTPRPRKVARLNHAGLQALKTKLSHQRVYLRHACSIFETRHDDEVGNQKEEEVIPVADATAVSNTLECKWMTWKMMKSTVQELYRRAQAATASSESLNRSGDAEDADNLDSQDDPEPQQPPSPDFDEPSFQSRLPYLNLNPSVQIPRKLLQGPWTHDKTSFLSYLVRNQCSISWTSSSRGELATLGLSTAITTHNHLAAGLLLSPAINVIPTAATLRSAVIDHGCDVTIVFYLINAALRTLIQTRGGHTGTDVSFRDAPLWSWASRVSRDGNEKGKWLLETLKFAGDVAKSRSVYDENLFQEFVRACGREEQGVVLLRVPVVGEETPAAVG